MTNTYQKLVRIIQLSSILIILFSAIAKSQDCSTTITIKLNNINGGYHIGQKVTLTSKSDGKKYEQNSNNIGEVTLIVPCNEIYELTIPNYANRIEMQSHNGGTMKKTLTYSATMVENAKNFALTDAEKVSIDKVAEKLPDSTVIAGYRMATPTNPDYFVSVKVRIVDFGNKPIPDEQIVLKGLKRNKRYIGKTNSSGVISLFVPKGDMYSLSFKYHKDYSSVEYRYTKGTTEVELSISYLGTKEIERRKKEEVLRIAELDRSLKAEREKFELDCKKRKISLEEGYRLEWKRMREDYKTDDNVIIDVLNRNKWFEKLIMCDLTGSMQPYSVQLSVWYQMNYKKEKNLQFVFFNDGDQKSDDQKIIGESGGIYYSPSKGLDSLGRLMSKITANGDGGDCAENNLEALIKGTKMANPYKEIVMIVDNNSPIKDIKLLDKFNKPVHIILCGVSGGSILPDYLLLAWKTKGTIHTIEEDITSIAKMSEGQEIKIGKITYRIMGGEFVRITDV